MYRKSIAYRQVKRFKRICLIDEKLNSRLKHLKLWLVKRGYKEHHVDSEIEKVKLIKRSALFQKQNKNDDDSKQLFLRIIQY